MDKDFIEAQIAKARAELANAPDSVHLAMAMLAVIKPLVHDIASCMSVGDQRLFYKALLAGISGYIEASFGIGSAAAMLTEQGDLARRSEELLRTILLKMGH